jgi:hypothetical protein
MGSGERRGVPAILGAAGNTRFVRWHLAVGESLPDVAGAEGGTLMGGITFLKAPPEQPPYASLGAG